MSIVLKVENLKVAVKQKIILNSINLTVRAGEVHAIMGPNGSGKSTLANILAGRNDYEILEGSVIFKGQDLLSLTADERAAAGVFLAFQYPVEIPGVSNIYLLKAAYNALCKQRGATPADAMDFLKIIKDKLALLQIDQDFLYRSVNEGFSGGEKKRNEILQMAILDPSLAILDEIDSGLDIDALKTVAEGINHLRTAERAMIMVTHYQRLLNYIKPDYVHILANGNIVRSGDAELAKTLEKTGYSGVTEATLSQSTVVGQ